jgi:hypothetical protein
MYSTDNIEKLEVLYSILREKHPKKLVKVVYDYNTKLYNLVVTNEKYTCDPEVPLDLSMKVVYGDSVMKGTPILIRNADNEMVTIKPIECIFDTYKECISGKEESVNPGVNIQVYAKNKWNNITKVIRHKTDKVMYSISNERGIVNVTEDHSLLTQDENEIKPTDCTYSTKLLYSYPTTFFSSTKLNQDVGYTIGLLLKYTFWRTNELYVNIVDFEKFNTTFFAMFGILLCTEHVNKDTLRVSIQAELMNRFMNECINTLEINGMKKVPDTILNSAHTVLISFLVGYLDSDEGNIELSNSIECAGFYYIFKKLGYKVNVLDECTLLVGDEMFAQPLSIIKLKTVKDYVYDIETDLGTFQAGVGETIVKNTDSIFIEMKYNREDYELNRRDSFKIAGICGNKLTADVFNRKPIEMEFEKVFQPFILLTKKRYIGKKFEDLKNPLKMKEITAAGIALTRRDYSQFVKNCYTEVIDKIINESDVVAGVNVVKRYITSLEEYNVDIDSLVLSAQLAKEYKTSPVHVILAKKLKERSEEVQVGDRIPYIFIETTDKTLKKSELGEDPEYVKKHGLKINRECYLEQLAKPLLGFFKVVLQNDEARLQELIDFTNEKMVMFGGKKLKSCDFILPATE